MDLQEARDTLFCHLTDIQAKYSECFSYGQWQLAQALEFVVDKLDKELAVNK